MSKRIVSCFLVVIMIVGLIPAAIFVGETTGVAQLCKHHPEHTVECGYMVPTQGTPCNHQHSEECYELVKHYIPECYPQADTSSQDGSWFEFQLFQVPGLST